jgi:uncharacterized protein (TIGR03086 family)
VTMANGPVRLLQHAICYAVESVDAVPPGTGSLPTPCEAWDLRTLLLHLNRSIDDLLPSITLEPADRGPASDDGRASTTQLAATFRTRTRLLLQSCLKSEPAGRGGWVVIVAAAEIAVHGWDVAVACGTARSIPDPLALGLLVLLQMVIEDAARHPLFGPPIPVSPLASPSDQLVAFLGRLPFRPPAGARFHHRGELR